jgi:hypothetical protein
VVLVDGSHGGVAVDRDLDDLQILLVTQGELERLAERALVVDDEDPGRVSALSLRT